MLPDISDILVDNAQHSLLVLHARLMKEAWTKVMLLKGEVKVWQYTRTNQRYRESWAILDVTHS